MSASYPLRCKCRRQAPTGLRCNRCNVPICPDCSIVAPVGMMCRGCARGGKSRLYEVSPGSLGLAFLACLAVGSFGGWIMAFFGFGLGFMGLWAAFVYGLLVAETALRVTGRKRGTIMEILVGVCVALGLIIGLGIQSTFSPEMGRLLLYYLKSPFLYLSVGIAIVSAVGRIRSL